MNNVSGILTSKNIFLTTKGIKFWVDRTDISAKMATLMATLRLQLGSPQRIHLSQWIGQVAPKSFHIIIINVGPKPPIHIDLKFHSMARTQLTQKHGRPHCRQHM